MARLNTSQYLACGIGALSLFVGGAVAGTGASDSQYLAEKGQVAEAQVLMKRTRLFMLGDMVVVFSCAAGIILGGGSRRPEYSLKAAKPELKV